MFRFVSKEKVLVVISLIFLISVLASAENVRICVWEGTQKPLLESFKGKYRGQLSLVKFNGKYFVINTMDIEEYLFGVIGKEMGPSWPFEALKAQAVCSRTLIYYYKEIAAKKKAIYDVSDTIYHQVYGGITSENEALVRAVEETSNQVLAGQNDNNGYNIIPSFFHACCGGHTCSASNVWGMRSNDLVGVEDPYCNGTPFYRWSKTFNKDEISSMLGMDVSSVTISEYDEGGRAKQLEFSGKFGKKYMSAEKFRMLTINGSTTFSSSKTLPSTMFSIMKRGNDFIFNGTGYGHGVGLCQWGARTMAEEGKTYIDILKHYFPALTLMRINKSGNVSTLVPLVEPEPSKGG
ncbi:MAG: SpoIID/LytB domain-containing protein [Candidatus Omnitrophica bacterium]|nr:SpoIID/LytB domain-containing protein [Candidatus Omnitrophota bacterium]